MQTLYDGQRDVPVSHPTYIGAYGASIYASARLSKLLDLLLVS